jgi:2-phosphosulfolactate phosphatase
VVLPSPNGSTITHALAALGCNVLAVSLRNATAAALWAKDRIGGEGTILAVASGEHWRPGGELRPAVEELWGAGAFLAALRAAGITELSPEAMTASSAVPGDLAATASGRELIAAGYPQDVAIAAERDTSDVVPLLTGDRYRQAHHVGGRQARTT